MYSRKTVFKRGRKKSSPYPNKHRILVEEEKPERERGYYLRPQVFNQPEEKSLEWARNPGMMHQLKSRPYPRHA